MMQNQAHAYPDKWAYEAMRTGDHLPPLMPRPTAPALPSRAPATLSYRHKSAAGNGPTTATSTAASTAGNPPQVGYFSAAATHLRRAPNANSEIPVPKYRLTEWLYEDDEDDFFADQPGHAAYYKSRKFQDSVAAGKVHIPGGIRDSSTISNKEAVKLQKAEAESLVLVFGLNNVRRATAGRKPDLRLQKRNRRAKWLRRTDGERSKFGWD